MYTPIDQLSTYTPPALGSNTVATQYSYDVDGKLTNVARPDGVNLVYGYDPAFRLSTQTIPQGALSRTYDPKTGQLSSITAPGGEKVAYAYDGFLRTGVTWSGPVAGSLVLGFDTNLRVASQTVNAGTKLLFGYDADSLMTSAGAITVNYDPQNGLLTGTTLGSLADSYSYDPNGLLASYSATFGATNLYSEVINTRDAVGRILKDTETVGSVTHLWGYTYDATGRLTDVTEDGAAVSHYGYDADDNRTTATTHGTTVIPTYDAQDRLLTYGAASYQYSANGELSTKTVGAQSTSYTYDAFGNLLHVGLPGGPSVDYVPDGENRRLGKKVNSALTQGLLYQDALRVVAQLDGSGNVASRFVFGSKTNVPDYMTTAAGSTYRIFSNHLGSPRLVVDSSSGAVVEKIDYDEFGNVVNDTNPGFIPFGFAGGLHDQDTKLVRFGARDYDPSVGRWTSKDPVQFQGGSNEVDPGFRTTG